MAESIFWRCRPTGASAGMILSPMILSNIRKPLREVVGCFGPGRLVGTVAAMDHLIARVPNLRRWPYAIALKGKLEPSSCPPKALLGRHLGCRRTKIVSKRPDDFG